MNNIVLVVFVLLSLRADAVDNGLPSEPDQTPVKLQKLAWKLQKSI